MYEVDQKTFYTDLINEIFFSYFDSIENTGYLLLVNDEIRYANKYFFTLTGYQKELLIGLSFKNFTPDYCFEESIKNIDQHDFSDDNQIIPFYSSDGKTLLFNAKKKIYIHHDKKIIFLCLTHYKNITEKNEVELYQAVLNTVTENIFLIDKELTILKTVKIKSDQYNISHSLSEFFSHSAIKLIKKNIETNWTKTELRFFELQNSKKYFEVKLFPFQHNSYVFAFSEISLKKRIENQLIDSQIQLRQLNNEKDQLMSIIAHDLKNPFNIINGFCSVLINSGKSYPSERKEEIIKHIYTASLSGHNLLENLLEWSKSQSERIMFSPEEIGLQQVINYIINFYAVNIANKKLIVENKVDPCLAVYADKNMLSTVLRNLVSNAIKFTSEKGEIVIDAVLNTDNYIQVSVKDSGIGLSEKQISNLFKIGKNSSTRGTQGEKGSGLGLLLCKEFIEKHKGTIDVTSKKNEGSEFIFTIPVSLSVNKMNG